MKALRKCFTDYVLTSSFLACAPLSKTYTVGLLQLLVVPTTILADVAMDFIDVLLHVNGH
jgi:hypothetical protein